MYRTLCQSSLSVSISTTGSAFVGGTQASPRSAGRDNPAVAGISSDDSASLRATRDIGRDDASWPSVVRFILTLFLLLSCAEHASIRRPSYSAVHITLVYGIRLEMVPRPAQDLSIEHCAGFLTRLTCAGSAEHSESLR